MSDDRRCIRCGCWQEDGWREWCRDDHDHEFRLVGHWLNRKWEPPHIRREVEDSAWAEERLQEIGIELRAAARSLSSAPDADSTLSTVPGAVRPPNKEGRSHE